VSNDEYIVTSTRPVEEKHVTPVSIIGDFDYVVVVGSYTIDSVDSVFKRFGNKASFINQGIRQMRLDQEQIRLDQERSVGKGKRKRGVFLMFREEYDQNVLDKVQKIAIDDYQADFAVLDNISELVAFINRRPAKKRRIQQMAFFAHGLVGSIEFGYETDKEDSYRLRDAQAKMLEPLAFDNDAVIYSYACRTGVGVSKGIAGFCEDFEEGEDPHYERSLAQIIADHADVHVMAYPRRSNYGDTYGTAEDWKHTQATRKKMKTYRERADVYEKQMKDYAKRKKRYDEMLAVYRLGAARQGTQDVRELPGYPPPIPPSPPVKDYSDEDEELVRREDTRAKNQEKFGLPIDPKGAVRPVKSGDTPEGLPTGLKKFIPAARKEAP
jgi:hypothetical protein